MGDASEISQLIESITRLLAAIGGLGFIGYFGKRWWERPRLNVHLRRIFIDYGPSAARHSPQSFVFEAANLGGRPAALRPVVRMRGIEPRLSRRRWYPGFLGRFMSEETIIRWHLCVPIEGPVNQRVEDRMNVRGEGEELTLGPHSGMRGFEDFPARTESHHGFVIFRRYDFWFEGTHRTPDARVRVLALRAKRVGWFHFWAAYTAFRLWGRYPEGPEDLGDYLAEGQARR